MPDFGLTEKPKNKTLQLWETPKKDKGLNKTHFSNTIEKGTTHQADLLFMPVDKGYPYILVVVDVGSRKVDAEPIKNKDSSNIKKAFKTIYSRKHISMPTVMIQTDPGAEFNNPIVKKYFEDKNVFMRFGRVGRSQQQAIVEAMNKKIAKALFNAMYAIEIETNEVNNEWVDNLPILIKLINRSTKHKIKKIEESKSPVCSGDSCKLLDVGQKVHVILEEPREFLTDKKLIGKFRATDMRFEKQLRTIEQVILKPDLPPLYKVSGIKHTAFTKNQLKIIENEQIVEKATTQPKAKPKPKPVENNEVAKKVATRTRTIKPNSKYLD